MRRLLEQLRSPRFYFHGVNVAQSVRSVQCFVSRCLFFAQISLVIGASILGLRLLITSLVSSQFSNTVFS
jgi:hypothetical protein